MAKAGVVHVRTKQPMPPEKVGNGRELRRVVLIANNQLITNQRWAASYDQNSLKAGVRGALLFADFVSSEKITHSEDDSVQEWALRAPRKVTQKIAGGSLIHLFGLENQVFTQASRRAMDRLKRSGPTTIPRFAIIN